MDSRSGSGLNGLPVNKSADILGLWMHVPQAKGHARSSFSMAQPTRQRTQVKYPDRECEASDMKINGSHQMAVSKKSSILDSAII
jgi:hypothetical protein